MAHYILSEQWKKARKTPLQLYRTPGLAEPGSDCGHWDEDTVDNELMSPVINVDSNPLSILTAGPEASGCLGPEPPELVSLGPLRSVYRGTVELHGGCSPGGFLV